MKVVRSVRGSALFIGSIVGAGFATGQEVLLFFGEDGVGSLVVASLFMALCAFAFMEIGARRAMDPRLSLATESLVSFSSLAVYAAMIAASEEVLLSLTGQAGLSLLLASAVSIVSGKGVARLSALNLIAVPFMTVIILLVGMRSGGRVVGGFHPLSALSYGGMNLLFSGAMMVKEGEGSSLAGRLLASILSGVLIFLLLFFMRRSVSAGSDMPFLDAAFREGLGTLARIALLLAILTTMASCAHLCIRPLAALTGDALLAGGVVTLVGIGLSAFGFAPIVRVSYPVVSYLGLVATGGALVFSVFTLLRTRRRAKLTKFSFKKAIEGIDSGEKS